MKFRQRRYPVDLESVLDFERPSAWDPGYALPENVLEEPPRFGTLTTEQMKRGTFDDPGLPRPWRAGYAMPDNVEDEPLGRGTMTTYQMPRGTVDPLAPPERPLQELNLLSGNAWRTMQSNLQTLSGDAPPSAEQLAPLRRTGTNIANGVLARLARVAPANRSKALKELFDYIEPGLWRRVDAQTRQLTRGGVTPAAALRTAISDQVQSGLVGELVETAKTRRVPRETILGLGCYGMGSDRPVVYAAPVTADRVITGVAQPKPSGPTVTTTRIHPCDKSATTRSGRTRGGKFYIENGKLYAHVSWLPKGEKKADDTFIPDWAECFRLNSGVKQTFDAAVAKARQSSPADAARVESGETAFAKFRDERGKPYAIYRCRGKNGILIKRKRKDWWGKTKEFVKDLGQAIVDIGEAIGGFVADAAEFVGGQVCDLVSTQGGQVAAGIGAAAAGQPPQAGIVGAQVAAGVCGSGAPPRAPYQPTAAVPWGTIALGVGALGILYIVLEGGKKKRR